MNTINFLPPAFIQKQARRRRSSRHILLIIGVICILAAWGVVQTTHTHRLNQYVAMLEGEVAAAESQKSEINKLRAEHALLINQVKIQRELAQPVSHTQIIALLSEVIDPSVGVTDLTMITHHPKPQTRQEIARHAKQSKQKHTKKRKKHSTTPHWIEIEFEGIAPNDIVIANVVAALSENPMFSGVQMHYTRQVERDGIIGRQFRLSTRIQLDRDFVPTHKEVARAH